jgi:hypothetical protein
MNDIRRPLVNIIYVVITERVAWLGPWYIGDCTSVINTGARGRSHK